MTKLEVCEIFYSLQGESTYSGMPCIFIRLSGCNLRCRYCDTIYSHRKGKELSLSEIEEQIVAYPTRLVELTGGEPLCQPGSILLMQRLIDKGYNVLIETNGSLRIKDIPKQVIRIVDVKCPSSGMGESFLPENLKYLKKSDELKFVIGDRGDYLFATEFLRVNKIKVGTVHFSPVSPDLSPKDLAEWILEDGLKVKLSLQLHKILGVE